jgi:hypothetical protein
MKTHHGNLAWNVSQRNIDHQQYLENTIIISVYV